MPDYLLCLKQYQRRRLDAVPLPEFRMPNDPTCGTENREGPYCNELFNEPGTPDNIKFSQEVEHYWDQVNYVDDDASSFESFRRLIENDFFTSVNLMRSDPVAYIDLSGDDGTDRIN
jgi:hypothetical protein